MLTMWCRQISIHVPREGHDLQLYESGVVRRYFNPRAPRGARPEYNPIENYDRKISIHVPREGHDAGDITAPIAFFAISIHVPREGHDC